MFDTVVIPTDGSKSAERAIHMGLDIAKRFDATVHALYVVDETEIDNTPAEVRDELDSAIRSIGDEAISFVEETADATGGDVLTALEQGKPIQVIIDYAEAIEADVIVMGTRGRHGEHAFLLGSVAEGVVRNSPIPVLTVRQLDEQHEDVIEDSPVSS